VVRVIRASVRPRAARANTSEREAAATRCVVALCCAAACVLVCPCCTLLLHSTLVAGGLEVRVGIEGRRRDTDGVCAAALSEGLCDHDAFRRTTAGLRCWEDSSGGSLGCVRAQGRGGAALGWFSLSAR
jgi:hypothetical protein